ncbi:MAG TPA: YHS domain-containing protein [Polyangiaceae bacterium]|nr:YHS domain-containing protein [Polyangiaceae bacterium]
MLKRSSWLDAARKLDWEFSYVREEDVFPEIASGKPWLFHDAWKNWDEPFRTTYAEYVKMQCAKGEALGAVREAVGKPEDFEKLPAEWRSVLKLHAATLPLAEFAAVVGNLRGARFGRDSAWRTMATLGALDELRHTQIPLSLMHSLVRADSQFDWTHRLYHSNNWVAIAARHLADELLLASNAVEFAIGTHYVFETGFTNLQFVALATLARDVGDKMFEAMVHSIQSDEARHAQIGLPVLEIAMQHDRAYAQYLLDKWFWRSFLLFAVVTGFSMDYLTPVEHRARSFKEFMQEWVVEQYLQSIESLGLEKPWYWDTFLSAVENYHHMVYASAYTYRASVWFDFVVPGPRERAWLKSKYPSTWDMYDPIWQSITDRWKASDIGNDFAVHGTAIVTFCDMCQLVLSGGTPEKNTANTLAYGGKKYIFCSGPCRWIFTQEPHRYQEHKDVVKRVLAGEAPPNLIALLTRYFGLDYATWGRDAFRGDYPFIQRGPW